MSGSGPGDPQPGPGAAQDGRITVPVTDRLPARLPAEGIPAGWDVKEFTGRADVVLLRDERPALRLLSEGSSFALYRDVVVDTRVYPFLSWAWKVTRLPAGGDVRTPGTDDQAAQVYVVFPRWPAPQASSDVIGYVWDTTAPVDTRVTSPRARNVKIIVVDSGTRELGTWREHQRNVAEDYAALFGRRPPRVGKIALMVDSNDTHSATEALFAGLAFTQAPTKSMENTTSMLR